jgi:hypothetical protein
MLKVPVGRLTEPFPESKVQMITRAANLLSRICPKATQIDLARWPVDFSRAVIPPPWDKTYASHT